MPTTANPAHVFALHRYFICADRMGWHFYQILPTKKTGDEAWEIACRLYMSYWYAGLYVVIEGWRELGLTDEAVDRLLESPNVPLLRRFRNGAFHFQREYDDARFLELISEGEDVIPWVQGLREAFSEFFLSWFKETRSGQK